MSDPSFTHPGEAVIPFEKLTRYLLVPQDHGDKSRFFAQAGFLTDNPEALLAAIELHLQSHAVEIDGSNAFGDFYRIEGALVGPSGHRLDVVTIWIHLHADSTFRFVTLKPLRGRST